MQFDSTDYTFLGEQGNIRNRYLVRYDSTISHIDTAIHYRYFTVQERLTDLRRSILEHDVNSDRGRITQLIYEDGRYRFFTGRTEPSTSTGQRLDPDGSDQSEDTFGDVPLEELSPVVKIDPQRPRPRGEDAIDIFNYRFLNEEEGAPPSAPEQPGSENAVVQQSSSDTTVAKPFTFPEQRNYNLNFTIDEVVTQVDNSYSNQFYQPFTGPNSLNPGLSGLTRMSISDLFEDHRIIGGFRLALDLNNNDYMLAWENLTRRLDKRIMFQRQAYQGLTQTGVIKVHTHNVRYQLSWPFSELASVRGSVMYRNDRYVNQAIDNLSLIARNFHDHMLGAKLEWIYDSSLPRGLNLWIGWKLKVFGEYYQHPDEKQSDMQVVGLDLRNSLQIHRELIWVNRIAGAMSMGNRKIIHFLGGVDNWLFQRVDPSMPIDFEQNYYYQTMGVPMRGFYYNARNGSSFGVVNSELRVPIIRYLVNRPIRSDLLNHLQLAAFADVGSAWTGAHPYADDNSFNQLTIYRSPLTITLTNQREPIVYGYGFGARTRLLGYFVRADWAWGVDDGIVLPRVFYFSLSLDI